MRKTSGNIRLVGTSGSTKLPTQKGTFGKITQELEMRRQRDSRDILTPFIGPCVAIWRANFSHSKTGLGLYKKGWNEASAIDDQHDAKGGRKTEKD